MLYFITSSALLLVYAAAVMTLLLDVHPMKLNFTKKMVYFIGISLVILIHSVVVLQVGVKLLGKYYPLVGQLPIFLVFCIVSRRETIKVFFVLLTAIFLSFPYMVLSTLAGKFLQPHWWRFLAALPIAGIFLLCINWWMKSDFDYVMEYFTSLDIIKFCAIPVLYSILNYSVAHYTSILPTLPMRGLIFLSALAAYFLTMDVFRRTREMQQMKSEQILMEARIAAADGQLSTLRATQEQAAVYRHDMRHHFALIGRYLADGEISNAIAYIGNAQSDIDAITPVSYCLNSTVNLILSSFAAKAAQAGVTLEVQADLPPNLPIPKTELCAILSNGLENAISAAEKAAEASKTVQINCCINKGHLLICIVNPYAGELLMQNGVPQSQTKGHGFGIKSIEMLTKKYDGYCSFLAEESMATLKIALKLDGD